MAYKSALGERGLYEQSRVNERFMVGDQWHGARCGSDRPLVRHNIIKRIGDYKLAVVGGSPVAVSYTAEGVPCTAASDERVRRRRAAYAAGTPLTDPLSDNDEAALLMSVMSDYFRVTAERVRLDALREQALHNAYVSGTGVLYTYWDSTVPTGLYADAARRVPLRGDLMCEVLDIENVYFGDPTCDDIQRQPYIVIARRCALDELRARMKAHGRPVADIDRLRADDERHTQPGDYGTVEQAGSRRALVLTKLYRDPADGHIHAVQVCRGVTVRPPWDIGIRRYPLAAFSWERRRGCAYGESEITYLIPNQIAINRMLTASVWAVMMMGMPMLVVNGDLVQQPVTNEPGRLVTVFGGASDVTNALHYVNPPSFAPAFDNNIASLINNTLTQSGANQSALGDVNPENTSAIIAVREAAMLPLQTVQTRYYAFLEDLARIWAEFWVRLYGDRPLKVCDGNGVWYLPFSGAKAGRLLINARVDVGAATVWSESESVRALDGLLDHGIITPRQYLQRLPRGTVPDIGGLLRELNTAPEVTAS